MEMMAFPLIMPSSTGGLVGAQHDDWTAVTSTFWTCTHTTTGSWYASGRDASQKEETRGSHADAMQCSKGNYILMSFTKMYDK